ncbi:hypothetical protein PIB30_003426 [Stylosanthes scabra]|uniref:SANT domain-containing protein n=1 Tax=Stylosanthes scabra TaxID=79078 RepID=A0ABU6U2W3_9FABA|nr:hypothetical protein [Stylosanthes scabra]
MKSSDASDDKFGDPELPPHVGEEHQAEIPPFIDVPYRSQLIKKTRDSDIRVNWPESFSLGLPIPLMWSHCKLDNSNWEASGSFTIKEGQMIPENGCPKLKVEFQTTLLGEGQNVAGFTNLQIQSSVKSAETDTDSYMELKTEQDQSRGKYLLPGLLVNQSWTDTEYESFLLGLYIFGKNLSLVKRFVGTKNMGDILAFYYGKFYRSKGYRRWSECRKLRNRRCIYGQKIFTGWRQQELLSRMFSHVAGECQTLLTEISRKFVEGKMPFEEYVFSLKNAVGIELLIAVVGIGKGKQDLTGTANEPTKTTSMFSIRAEIPVGKACSSLTPADIIKFLTGNFRLSKARSNDLFWEAVWPRLLAKGWHSEQPKDQFVTASKPSLVFLIPGVKKFSRRKLVKGNHYFDSISDVLNKVALEPGLIENEIQAGEGNLDEENKQFRYLQPLSSKANQEHGKFTVVDTSMVIDLHQRNVRQLRSLPLQTMSISDISSSSTESEQDTSEDAEEEVEQGSPPNRVGDHIEQADSSNHVEDRVEQANSLRPGGELSATDMSIDALDLSLTLDERNTTTTTTTIEVENHGFHSEQHDENHSREINEHEFIQNAASDCSNCFPNVMKIQKCTASNHEECTSVDRKFDLNEPVSPSTLHEESEGVVLSMDSDILSHPCDVAKGSWSMNNEGSATQQDPVEEVSAEKSKSKTRMLIDLNFPQVEPEFGIDINMERDIHIPSSNVMQQNDTSLSSPSEAAQPNAIQEYPDHHDKEQQSGVANRRQSTRNRPLTTKALEALEYRFLNSKRKRKSTECSESNSSKSRYVGGSSNNGTIVSGSCDNGIGNSMADTRAEEENVMA